MRKKLVKQDTQGKWSVKIKKNLRHQPRKRGMAQHTKKCVCVYYYYFSPIPRLFTIRLEKKKYQNSDFSYIMRLGLRTYNSLIHSATRTSFCTCVSIFSLIHSSTTTTAGYVIQLPASPYFAYIFIIPFFSLLVSLPGLFPCIFVSCCHFTSTFTKPRRTCSSSWRDRQAWTYYASLNFSYCYAALLSSTTMYDML